MTLADMEAIEQLLNENMNDIRVDELRRLGEQAMSDLEFRAVARHDLPAALKQFGYDLNPQEMALVLRFRDALAEAGIDLFLEERFEGQYEELLSRLVS